MTDAVRSYQLAFLLSEEMGERFVARMYETLPPQYGGKAPVAGGLSAYVQLPGQITGHIWYFAYGRDMSRQQLARRLRWTDDDAKKAWRAEKPRRATLEHFRLEFGAPAADRPGIGYATIVSDPQGRVEGVLYRLPPDTAKFLDAMNPGYRRIAVQVADNGRPVEALAYLAEPRDGLKPSRDYLESILAGAQEHGLSPEYIEVLKQQDAVEPPSATGGGSPPSARPGERLAGIAAAVAPQAPGGHVRRNGGRQSGPG